MREFKFRGQDYQGKWHYGSLVLFNNGISAIAENDLTRTDDGEHDGEYGLIKTTGQSTGLFDKNGKEIYEGDILTSIKNKYLVLWDETRASFYAQMLPTKGIECYTFLSKNWTGKMVIIGNIYDNPDLVI